MTRTQYYYQQLTTTHEAQAGHDHKSPTERQDRLISAAALDHPIGRRRRPPARSPTPVSSTSCATPAAPVALAFSSTSRCGAAERFRMTPRNGPTTRSAIRCGGRFRPRTPSTRSTTVLPLPPLRPHVEIGLDFSVVYPLPSCCRDVCRAIADDRLRRAAALGLQPLPLGDVPRAAKTGSAPAAFIPMHNAPDEAIER